MPQDLPTLFQTAFNTALAIGGMLAVARLVYAGAIYMTTDLPGAKGNAKTIIGETMMGLGLLLAVWLILNQINPQILNLSILGSVTPVEQAPAPPSLGPVDGGVGGGVDWCQGRGTWNMVTGECSAVLDAPTCAGLGGRQSGNNCVFDPGRPAPAGTWCTGIRCFATEDACNAVRNPIDMPCEGPD